MSKLLKIIIVILLNISVFVHGSVLNGEFDAQNSEMVPYEWESLHYAVSVKEFIPVPAIGHPIQWKVPKVGDHYVLKAEDDGYFAVISTGNPDMTGNFAVLQQLVTVSDGETIRGKYLFGTCDYLGWNDHAEIELIHMDNIPVETDLSKNILLASADVAGVGSYSSHDGWQSFEYRFSPEQAGEYILSCKASDLVDDYYESYLFVDKFEILPLPPYGDFNRDESVDLEDYARLSSCWLVETDPNSIIASLYVDPNMIDPNNIDPNLVDPNELEILLDKGEECLPCLLRNSETTLIDIEELQFFAEQFLWLPPEED